MTTPASTDLCVFFLKLSAIAKTRTPFFSEWMRRLMLIVGAAP
jgi:hypothetical protein